MPKKPPRGKKKPAPPAPSPASVPAVDLNGLLERLEEQQRVVLDAVASTREALTRRIDELDTKLTSKLDVLKLVVRQTSSDLQRNNAEIRKNSEELQAVAQKLDGKADARRVSEIEERVEAFGAEPTQS